MSEFTKKIRKSYDESKSKRTCQTMNIAQKEYIFEAITNHKTNFRDSHHLSRLIIKHANQFHRNTGLGVRLKTLKKSTFYDFIKLFNIKTPLQKKRLDRDKSSDVNEEQNQQSPSGEDNKLYEKPIEVQHEEQNMNEFETLTQMNVNNFNPLFQEITYNDQGSSLTSVDLIEDKRQDWGSKDVYATHDRRYSFGIGNHCGMRRTGLNTIINMGETGIDWKVYEPWDRANDDDFLD